jgi:hypothetical protein
MYSSASWLCSTKNFSAANLSCAPKVKDLK